MSSRFLCPFKQLFLVSLFTTIFFYGNSQEEILFFNKLSSEKGGISENQNYEVRRDSQDNIWVSSLNGLLRYDGLNSNLFGPDNSNLSKINIQSPVISANDGDLWFSTRENIYVYRQATKKIELIPISGPDNDTITGIFLFHYNPKTNQFWLMGTKNSPDFQYQLYSLNVGEENKLVYIDDINYYRRQR